MNVQSHTECSVFIVASSYSTMACLTNTNININTDDPFLCFTSYGSASDYGACDYGPVALPLPTTNLRKAASLEETLKDCNHEVVVGIPPDESSDEEDMELSDSDSESESEVVDVVIELLSDSDSDGESESELDLYDSEELGPVDGPQDRADLKAEAEAAVREARALGIDDDTDNDTDDEVAYEAPSPPAAPVQVAVPFAFSNSRFSNPRADSVHKYASMRRMKLAHPDLPMDTVKPVHRPPVRKRRKPEAEVDQEQSKLKPKPKPKRARSQVKATVKKSKSTKKPKKQVLRCAWELPRDELAAKVTDFYTRSVAEMVTSFLTANVSADEVLTLGKFKAMIRLAKVVGVAPMLSVEGTEFDFALLGTAATKWLTKNL